MTSYAGTSVSADGIGPPFDQSCHSRSRLFPEQEYGCAWRQSAADCLRSAIHRCSAHKTEPDESGEIAQHTDISLGCKSFHIVKKQFVSMLGRKLAMVCSGVYRVEQDCFIRHTTQ